MRPMPIRYVQNIEKARDFYETLGLNTDFISRKPRRGPSAWLELQGDAGYLALHHVPPGAEEPAVELAFEATEPLEAVRRRLLEAGYRLETEVVDEAYGRSFTVRDPEGLLIQINEHDRELHS